MSDAGGAGMLSLGSADLNGVPNPLPQLCSIYCTPLHRASANVKYTKYRNTGEERVI